MDTTFTGTMVFSGDKGWRLNPLDGSVKDTSQKELANFKDSAWATQGMLNPEMQDVNPFLEDSLFSKKSVKKKGFHMDLSGFDDATAEPVLVHQVNPIYPELAARARVSGKVVLRIVIDEEGLVQDVIPVEGHAMLKGAAVEAVRQWRYRPTVQDEKPVSVSTMVEVYFEIGDRPPVILQGPGIRIY